MTVGFGMNDAETGRGITVQMYKDNLKKFILHRNQRRPNAEVLFLAPPVTDSSTRTGTIASYRTAMQEVANDAVLGGTSRGVYYYDTSTAFELGATPATDLNNISTERTPGNRVHPSGYGHGLIFDNVTNGGIRAVLETMKISLIP
jgi:lysophospholipase L1-like esterase